MDQPERASVRLLPCLTRLCINEHEYIITTCAANSNVALRINRRQAAARVAAEGFFLAGSGMAPVHPVWAPRRGNRLRQPCPCIRDDFVMASFRPPTPPSSSSFAIAIKDFPNLIVKIMPMVGLRNAC
jgi:hypothetical protein